MAALFRYLSESMKRLPDEDTRERLRELGHEGWELVTVLPGSQTDPDDASKVTYYLMRDASTDIGL